MKKIEDTPFYSKKIGDLPKGCQMCVKGEKLVLYITGICPRHCWYCPLSEQRKDKDVIFVNEWKTDSKEDLIKEVELCSSKGAGITGGDPLSRLDRTVEYIELLKEKFGKGFHIHLYTSFVLVTEDNLRKLYDAGLDEIRFHPDLDDKSNWENVENALLFDWDVGIEIPCIPDKKREIFDVCDFFDGKIKFLNLNEFEIADTNSEGMFERGFVEKSDTSFGILGSSGIGSEVLEYCLGKSFDVHFCSSKLKDKVQMQNRFKLRAQNVSTDFDVITDEGLLLRGVIYLKGLENGVQRVENSDGREEVLKKLYETKKMLEDEGLELMVDEKKLRLLTYPEHVEQFCDVLKSLGLVPCLIEEDPTVEAFEVNCDFL